MGSKQETNGDDRDGERIVLDTSRAREKERERERERERSKGEAEMVPGGFSVENLGRGIKQVRTAEYGGLKESTSLEPNRSINNKVKLALVRDGEA
jgi:hypothetical protein